MLWLVSPFVLRLSAYGSDAASLGFVRGILVDLSERVSASCDPVGCLVSDWLAELDVAVAVLEAAPQFAIADGWTQALLEDVVQSPVFVGRMLAAEITGALFSPGNLCGTGDALLHGAIASTNAAVRLLDHIAEKQVTD